MADHSPGDPTIHPADPAAVNTIGEPLAMQAAPTGAATLPGLASRTFMGLLIAQFFAAFNDQALHASAMFFAINSQTLTERDAISLMPILFYAPWALFCTVAGYLADRYGKRDSLVFWKIVEVAITAIALLGFWLGSVKQSPIGPWIVLSTVFMMGTHSAFFVPAKYGIMPELLPAEKLSKGNGLLESLSFLAVILGTVSGGVLSFLFLKNEYVIGIVLLSLAIIGAAASFLIRRVPAANPTRAFPKYIYGPLWANIKTLVSTLPLRTALIGIAFFTFVVAFMRASVYMLGEAQNPRWDELKTSVVVGCVALGIGLGSPLAGWLSGRKIELRLVKFGGIGMILSCLGAGFLTDYVSGLVVCIALIGFFTGFYIVPLFTLLQHEAPKSSKGEMIATSNFINVTGAIAASLLFFGVVLLAQKSGMVPEVTDRPEVAKGELSALEVRRGRPIYFEVQPKGATDVWKSAEKAPGDAQPLRFKQVVNRVFELKQQKGIAATTIVEVDKKVSLGSQVAVTKYELSGVMHYDIRPADAPLDPDYDQRLLPRYLFIGAAGMTLLTLLVLWRPLRRLRQNECPPLAASQAADPTHS
jgi:MFS family permease